MRNVAVESWERICFLYVAIFKPHSKDVIFHFDSYPLVVHCVLLFVCGSSSVRRIFGIKMDQNFGKTWYKNGSTFNSEQ